MDGDDSQVRMAGGGRSAGLFLLALGMATTSVFAGPVIYVNQKAAGVNDGSSWTDAYTDLQPALDSAEASGGLIREIWVADGTYKPSKRTDPNDPRSATFQLLDGVAFYGGFEGTEASIDERNIDEYPTILSGDFNGDDQPDFANYDENAYHAVTARSVGKMTVVDGFTVTGGNAIGTTYDTARGAGIYLEEAFPLIRNCVFKRNFAGRRLTDFPYRSGGGAGVYAQVIDWYDETPILSFFNCRFTENSTVGTGGGVYLYQTAAEFTECSFAQNIANDGGGAAFYEVDQVVVDASRFDQNSSGGWAAGFSFSGGTLTVTDSVFSHNDSGGNGGALAARCKYSIAITDSEFVGNRGEFGGGGFISAYYQGAAIVRTRFVDNYANFGGGLLLESGRMEMTDCEFEQNTARGLAGGLYLHNGDATVRRVRFWSNRAEDGGAMASVWGSGAITDSAFVGNHADVGGAIHITSPELFDFDRCQFTWNYAEIGGGIAALGFNTQILNSLLANNEAAAYGGAISVGDFAAVTIDRCRIESNRALMGGGIAALWPESQTWIVNSLVAENRASAHGGGIAAGAGELKIENCTVAKNTAEALGGGMIIGHNPFITNSIVWGNVVDPEGSALMNEVAQIEGIEFADIGYSDIEGWSGTYGGEGNIGLDPLFVAPIDPDAPWGPLEPDFRLRPDSPCINAGNPKAPDLSAADLDGHSRILCGRVDIGAYEFGIGDFDCNRMVELVDFAGWASCATGPMSPSDDPPYKSIASCSAFDFDADADIDLRDFAEFLEVFSPASP